MWGGESLARGRPPAGGRRGQESEVSQARRSARPTAAALTRTLQLLICVTAAQLLDQTNVDRRPAAPSRRSLNPRGSATAENVNCGNRLLIVGQCDLPCLTNVVIGTSQRN